MRRIILTFMVAAFFVAAGAQSLTTYYVIFPKISDPSVENVFVADFEKANPLEETVDPQFGKKLAAGLKSEIHKSERYGNVEFVPQSWRRTDIYNVADDEGSAQWVVSGTFDITTDSKRETNAEIKNESATGILHNIPYEAIYYDYKNSTNTKVTMELKDKQGNVIVTYDKERAAESNPKRDMRDPSSKLESHANLAASSQQFFVLDIANQFLPWMKAFKYEFRNIRNRDIRRSDVSRDRFRELRSMMRDESDFAKNLDYYGLGQLYKTLAEETGLLDSYINMAYVYEVLGNYTRAREIYEEFGDDNGIKRVDIFVRERERLESFGKDFFEPEI